MSDYRKVHDPFLNKEVLVSDKLTDRLRGKYASGPHLPNGNPEFGWRQFQAPPIQHEAAAEIERLEAQIASLRAQLAETQGHLAMRNSDLLEAEIQLANARKALEPFAAVAEQDIGADEVDSDIFMPMREPHNRAPRLRVGHLRAAKAALTDELHEGWK